jgi:hypothetical protein
VQLRAALDPSSTCPQASTEANSKERLQLGTWFYIHETTMVFMEHDSDTAEDDSPAFWRANEWMALRAVLSHGWTAAQACPEAWAEYQDARERLTVLDREFGRKQTTAGDGTKTGPSP